MLFILAAITLLKLTAIVELFYLIIKKNFDYISALANIYIIIHIYQDKQKKKKICKRICLLNEPFQRQWH